MNGPTEEVTAKITIMMTDSTREATPNPATAGGPYAETNNVITPMVIGLSRFDAIAGTPMCSSRRHESRSMWKLT